MQIRAERRCGARHAEPREGRADAHHRERDGDACCGRGRLDQEHDEPIVGLAHQREDRDHRREFRSDVGHRLDPHLLPSEEEPQRTQPLGDAQRPGCGEVRRVVPEERDGEAGDDGHERGDTDQRDPRRQHAGDDLLDLVPVVCGLRDVPARGEVEAVLDDQRRDRRVCLGEEKETEVRGSERSRQVRESDERDQQDRALNEVEIDGGSDQRPGKDRSYARSQTRRSRCLRHLRPTIGERGGSRELRSWRAARVQASAATAHVGSRVRNGSA